MSSHLLLRHNRIFQKLCILFVFGSIHSTEAVLVKDDILQRLNDFDSQACLLALKDQSPHPDTYTLPPELAAQMKELEQLRTQLQDMSPPDNNDGAITRAAELLKSVDNALLSNPLIRGKKVLAIKRHFPGSARQRTGGGLGLAPSNFQNNSEIGNPAKGWDNEFVFFEVGNREIREQNAYKPAPGMIISDPEPHWSGEKVMFSSIGTENRWHLFELNFNDKTVTQLTPPEYKDFDSFDGCYSPDGSYIFCSTATFLGLPCTNGMNKMCGLFSYNPETKKSRQLTFDQDSNWNPVVMDNGMILYQRWEYADLPHSNSRILFTMNPDGTSQLAFYGSNSYFPTALFGARPIPGKSGKLVGIAGGHHSVSRGGQMIVLDPSVSRHEAEGVIAEIPFRGKKVKPEVRDRFPDGKWPQFLHPYPLSDKYFLVSMKRSPHALWGIYLVDVFNNMTLIAQQEDTAILEPVVIERRQVPPIIPSRVNPESQTASVFLQDVYFGNGLKGIPRGTVKKLRIGSYSFSPWSQGGLLGTIGLDGPWDIKRILGEVDVEPDGSAMFTVPANEPIFVQPLDENGRALQIMRSWFTAMPGENVSCIGCHEERDAVVKARQTISAFKAPQPIQAFYGKERGFSFVHEIQPILDKRCISCHNAEHPQIPYFKGDKMLTDWSSGISGRGDHAYSGKFTESYYQLQRYVRRPGIESDMHMLTPMDVHASQTELFQILDKNHHNVQLNDEERRKLACWIDLNAPFHGRRSDIPCFDRAKQACNLKARYAPLFQVRLPDLEWLPERPVNITPELPKPRALPDTTVPSLPGWPYYKKGSGYNAQHQIALGHIRKSIDIADGIEMHLVKVPGGSFVMGSSRQPDEMPMSVQTIHKPFWIGQFEVTNEQFAAFCRDHDSRTEHRHGYQFGRLGYPLNKPGQPVVRVSWQEASAFCKWLSEKTGLKVSLPTEAQWEWACRAGSGMAYSFGDLGADFGKYANLGDKRLQEFAACTAHKFYESTRILDNPNRYDDWIPRDTTIDDGGFVSEDTGRYRPNSWDIYDMHGNVWEWTRSQYKPYPYNHNDGRNDTADETAMRVVRGGSWYDRPFKATSSFRLPYRGYQKVFNVGFRILIEE